VTIELEGIGIWRFSTKARALACSECIIFGELSPEDARELARSMGGNLVG